MDLDDLKATAVEEGDSEEWEGDEADGDAEADLSNAISLLEDVNNLLFTLTNISHRGGLHPYMHREVARLLQESSEFLAEMGVTETVIEGEIVRDYGSTRLYD